MMEVYIILSLDTFFSLWALEAHFVKLAKEQSCWSFLCDNEKRKMLIIMVYECFGWFLKIRLFELNKKTS